jgi:hypothetical protein
MMVAEDAIGVLPPFVFLLHMFVPTLLTWVVTTLWIERCWFRKRAENDLKGSQITGEDTCELSCFHAHVDEESSTAAKEGTGEADAKGAGDLELAVTSPMQPPQPPYAVRSPSRRSAMASPIRNQRSLSDGDLQHYEIAKPEPPQSVISKIIHIVASPFPYAILFLLFVMIALIFVDVISIAGLIVCAAVVMVCFTVIGNHWQGKPIWGTDCDDGRVMTAEEKKKNTNEFFEKLFDSLDYSLLIIFLGLFVVLENVASTGIPRWIWSRIVGETPFRNTSSVVGICFFVVIASQFLGNVPVIQLAKPNVEYLDDDDKRYAWAILSFVATIGGNLTITGSAANIIVAEKANRLDPDNSIDFFSHYKICFWVTLLSCAVGVLFITASITVQSSY